MSSAVPKLVQGNPPGGGEDRPRHRARKHTKRGKHRLAKLGHGVVGLFFALQLILALTGLVVLPLYLMYEFIIQ